MHILGKNKNISKEKQERELGSLKKVSISSGFIEL